MSDEIAYKVKIEGDGLVFEREIPKEIGEQILILILSGGAQLSKVSKPLQTAHPVSPETEEKISPQQQISDVSVREFLDEHNAKRNPDIITAVGVYLSTHNNQQTFTKEDLLNAFEAAAEPTPKNLPRDIKWAIKIGWIAEKRGMEDTYYVTSSGRNVVNLSFPSDLVKKTTDPFKGKKASVKKEPEIEA